MAVSAQSKASYAAATLLRGGSGWAVALIRDWEKTAGRHMEIESSGGITIDTLRDYALCGVDFISVGALTHSVKGLDMSFKAVKE